MDWKHFFYAIFGNYFELSNKTLESDDGQKGATGDSASTETDINSSGIPSKKEKLRYVVVVGSIKTGKSSLCKTLASRISNDEDGAGEICREEDGFVYHMMEEQNIVLIDTPGIGGNITMDFKTLEKLVRLIKNIGHISLFVLTLHGQHPRLTEKHQEVLRLITSSLGTRFLKSTVVAFTFWEWDDFAEKTRKRSGETEEKKTSDINSYFKETFDTSHDVPTLFLDNYPNLNDNRQQRKLWNVREALHSWTETTSDYSFYD